MKVVRSNILKGSTRTKSIRPTAQGDQNRWKEKREREGTHTSIRPHISRGSDEVVDGAGVRARNRGGGYVVIHGVYIGKSFTMAKPSATRRTKDKRKSSNERFSTNEPSWHIQIG